MKIEQSAISLKTETNKSITDIGFDYGYSPSNYSSAFRKYHDISPVRFRNSLKTISILHPYYHLKTANFPTYKEYDQQTCIQKFAAYQVIYERHIGNYIELDQNWLDFTKKYHDYIDENTLLIERSYDDPCITNLGHCMYDICITVDKNCPLENVTTIPESKYAVYRYDGPVTEIFSAFQGLFHIWLAQSEYEMGERYGLGIYRSIDRYTLRKRNLEVKHSQYQRCKPSIDILVFYHL